MGTAEFDHASLFQFLMDGHIEKLRVLMKIQISEGGWSSTSEQLVKILRKHKDDWFYLQRMILSSLSLEYLSGYPGPLDILLKQISDTKDVEVVKNKLEESLIPLIQVDLEKNHSTLYYNIEEMSTSTSSVLVPTLLEKRDSEFIAAFSEIEATGRSKEDDVSFEAHFVRLEHLYVLIRTEHGRKIISAAFLGEEDFPNKVQKIYTRIKELSYSITKGQKEIHSLRPRLSERFEELMKHVADAYTSEDFHNLEGLFQFEQSNPEYKTPYSRQNAIRIIELSHCLRILKICDEKDRSPGTDSEYATYISRAGQLGIEEVKDLFISILNTSTFQFSERSFPSVDEPHLPVLRALKKYDSPEIVGIFETFLERLSDWWEREYGDVSWEEAQMTDEALEMVIHLLVNLKSVRLVELLRTLLRTEFYTNPVNEGNPHEVAVNWLAKICGVKVYDELVELIIVPINPYGSRDTMHSGYYEVTHFDTGTFNALLNLGEDIHLKLEKYLRENLEFRGEDYEHNDATNEQIIAALISMKINIFDDPFINDDYYYYDIEALLRYAVKYKKKIASKLAVVGCYWIWNNRHETNYHLEEHSDGNENPTKWVERMGVKLSALSILNSLKSGKQILNEGAAIYLFEQTKGKIKSGEQTALLNAFRKYPDSIPIATSLAKWGNNKAISSLFNWVVPYIENSGKWQEDSRILLTAIVKLVARLREPAIEMIAREITSKELPRRIASILLIGLLGTLKNRIGLSKIDLVRSTLVALFGDKPMKSYPDTIWGLTVYGVYDSIFDIEWWECVVALAKG